VGCENKKTVHSQHLVHGIFAILALKKKQRNKKNTMGFSNSAFKNPTQRNQPFPITPNKKSARRGLGPLVITEALVL